MAAHFTPDPNQSAIDHQVEDIPGASTAAHDRTVLDRRSVLRVGLAAGGAALLGYQRIAGAQAAPDATPGSAPNATPDANGLVPGVDYLPSPMPGVPDAFLRAPKPFKAIDAVPGRGGTVRFLTLLWGPAPPDRDNNQYWQELEKRLGVRWEPTFVPVAQYGERTATTLAGGDLPELFYFNPGEQAAHLNQAVQQGAFADLTDYLTGDAVKDYPYLAAIDPAVYHNMSINGRIYGIPKLVTRFDTVPFIRADWQKKLGLATPAKAEDFFGLMDGFTHGDPDGNGQSDTWGLGGTSGGWNVGNLQRMFRAPNGWRREADGSLTNAIETDEYRQNVEFCRRMQDAGLYHPDTATMTFEQEEGALIAGSIGLQSQGYASFLGSTGVRGRAKRVNPAADLRGLVLPGADGGKGVTYNGSGAYGFTAISTSAAKDEERVKELLRIMNYLLAPFASEEQIFLETGIEGVHHTVDDTGARVLTPLGEKEIGLFGYFPLVWLARPEPQVFFYPDAPGEAQYAQELAVKILSEGIDNPVMGLYSATDAKSGAELQQLGVDRISAIVAGRDDVSALKDYITEWRNRGGDKIRQEYQAQLAAK